MVRAFKTPSEGTRPDVGGSMTLHGMWVMALSCLREAAFAGNASEGAGLFFCWSPGGCGTGRLGNEERGSALRGLSEGPCWPGCGRVKLMHLKDAKTTSMRAY